MISNDFLQTFVISKNYKNKINLMKK